MTSPRFRFSSFGTPLVLLALVANMGVLSAKEEHEKPKEGGHKGEHAPKGNGQGRQGNGGQGRGENARPGGGGGGRPEGGNHPSPNQRPGGGQRFGGQTSFNGGGRPGGGGPGGAAPRQIQRTPGGGEIQRGPGGAVREVHTPGGAIITHGPGGFRQVQMARPGGGMLVASGNGRFGYVQRPMMFGGQPFVQRTYCVGGRSYAYAYRPWGYGGRMYNVYAPMHFYHPGFYGWAYRPWGRPVAYGWGWGARPWYGYYGGYFAPYPYYASPCFWLADFAIAATLETAYIAQQNQAMSAPPMTYDAQNGMNPEAKQAIADEVRRQMQQAQADQAAAQNGVMPVSGPPPLFTPQGPRIFLVSTNVMAYNGGQECPLSSGDVLSLLQTPAPGAEYADCRVMASRSPATPRGSIISVRTLDLQEMQNTMQANIDQGMAKLQTSQGTGGLPPMPHDAVGTVNAPYAAAVTPDDKALDDLDLAVKDATSSEQAVLNQGAQAPAPTLAPPPPAPAYSPTIGLGMTRSQVVTVLGPPVETVDLGAKMIYIYKNLKVTFLNGRVTDVQ